MIFRSYKKGIQRKFSKKMRFIFFIFILFCAQFLKAQIVDIYPKMKKMSERKPGWHIKTENVVLFDQNTFSNWIAGGVNSIALNLKSDIELNLTKEKSIWDNRLILGYGIQKNNGQGSRKSNDRIDFTSSYGYRVKKNWYFASSTTFKSQFTEGYDYSPDPKKKLTNFLSPAYITLGTGFDYKPSDNLQANIHFLTARVTLVNDESLQKKGNFGLKEDGDVAVIAFGMYLGGKYKFKVMKNVTFDNNLGLYSDYTHKVMNLDISYKGVLDMKINKFLSTQVSLDLLYDEDQINKVQLKQTMGIGLIYKFNNKKETVKKSDSSKTV